MIRRHLKNLFKQKSDIGFREAADFWLKGDREAALKWFDQASDTTDRRAFHIILANSQTTDENAWLRQLNAYQEQYPEKLSPIGLRNGSSENRIFDLRADGVAEEKAPFLVTVIIPAYNVEELIRVSAGSILNQTWRNLELIIVDDASTDQTMDTIQQIANEDDRVIFLQNEKNAGPYVAQNQALEIAKGKYVTTQGADDWSHPERIEKQVSALEKDPSIKANMGFHIRMTKEGKFPGPGKRTMSSPDGAARLSPASLVLEREFMQRHLGFWDSVRYAADAELIGRLRRFWPERLSTFDGLLMICLDSSKSLTREVSSSRKDPNSPRLQYRNAWKKWHKLITAGEANIDFPIDKRPFPAPPSMIPEING